MNRKSIIIFILTIINVLDLFSNNFNIGDRVMIKLHDYYTGVVTGIVGNNYSVTYYNGSTTVLPSSRIFHLKTDWKIGDWALTDWTNERIFLRVQVIYVYQDMFLCILWPQEEPKWRTFEQLISLEYANLLGNNYDPTENYLRANDNIVNARIQVEWNGSWYYAEILEEKDGLFNIHYIGYGDSWDEWVTESRIRRLDQGVVWKIGDTAWSDFTNEGIYKQVTIIESENDKFLCLIFPELDFRWKSPDELFIERPEQTFFGGK